MAPFGDQLILAMDTQGLGVFDPDTDTDPTVAVSATVTHVAGCPDGSALFLDDVGDLYSYAEASGEALLAAAPTDTVAVHCTDAAAVVAVTGGGIQATARDGSTGWLTWSGTLPGDVEALGEAP